MIGIVAAPVPFVIGILFPLLTHLEDYLSLLEVHIKNFFLLFFLFSFSPQQEVLVVDLDTESFSISHRSPSCFFTIRSSYDDRFIPSPLLLSPSPPHPLPIDPSFMVVPYNPSLPLFALQKEPNQ